MPITGLFGGIFLKFFIVKLQKISEIQPILPLTEYDFMQKYHESFRQSELGRIYEQLPLKGLAKAISAKCLRRSRRATSRCFRQKEKLP